MKNVIFVTPPDARYGFELAGGRQCIAEIGRAEEMINDLVATEEGGLIVIDERLLAGIDEEKLRELEGRWAGAFIILPAPRQAEVEMEDYARRFIAKAIGYHVRINP